MLRYGAPLILATVPTTLSARVDQLVVAQLVVATTEPAAELGRYTVSVSLAAVGVVVLASVGTILFPHLAALPPSEQIVALARAVRATVIVAFGVLVASAAAAPVVIPVVFGDDSAVPIVVPTALAVVTALLGLDLVLEAGFAVDAPVEILLAELAGIIATVALVIALLPPLGIGGAALGTIGGRAGRHGVARQVTAAPLRRAADRPLGPRRMPMSRRSSLGSPDGAPTDPVLAVGLNSQRSVATAQNRRAMNASEPKAHTIIGGGPDGHHHPRLLFRLDPRRPRPRPYLPHVGVQRGELGQPDGDHDQRRLERLSNGSRRSASPPEEWRSPGPRR